MLYGALLLAVCCCVWSDMNHGCYCSCCDCCWFRQKSFPPLNIDVWCCLSHLGISAPLVSFDLTFPTVTPFKGWMTLASTSLTPIIWPMAPSCDSVNPWHVSWISGQHKTHMPQLWNIVLWSLSLGRLLFTLKRPLCFVLYFHWVLVGDLVYFFL